MANLKPTGALSALAVCVAGALSLAVAMGIGRFAFTPMLPLMIRDGQLDLAAGGWLAAANYAGYLIGAMTVSRIGWSAPKLSAAALVATAALTAAMALPVPPFWWAGLRLLAGACSAWAFISTSVWSLGALARLRRLSWGSGVYAGVGAGISIAGLACLIGAAGGASAPALWLQLGALGLVLALPIFRILPRLDPAVAPPPSRAATAARLPTGTAGIVICYGVFGFSYILPATFLPVLARSVVDDPKLFGLAWPVFGLLAVLSTFGAGWCARHASRLQVWAAAHLLMGIGVLLPSLWLSGLTIGLASLLVGGTFMVVTMTGVQESRARAPHDPTPLLGRMTTAFAVGQIAGPVTSSLLLYLPWTRANGLDLALQAAAAGLFLTAIWLWHQNRNRVIAKEVSQLPG